MSMSGSGVIIMQLLYSDYLVWSGVSHHQKLFLEMTPAVEDGEDGEEKEDVAPLQEEVVRVESLQGAGRHDAQHHQVERQPGDQERSLPAAQTMASQADKGKVGNLFCFALPLSANLLHMADMVANIPKAPPQRIMLSLSVVWSVKAIT